MKLSSKLDTLDTAASDNEQESARIRTAMRKRPLAIEEEEEEEDALFSIKELELLEIEASQQIPERNQEY